jgi:hypothetical protein
VQENDMRFLPFNSLAWVKNACSYSNSIAYGYFRFNAKTREAITPILIYDNRS